MSSCTIPKVIENSIAAKLGLHSVPSRKQFMPLYCIKTYAINNRALISKKPCINKEFHVPLMHGSVTFHMQDSVQYPINTEEALS